MKNAQGVRLYRHNSGPNRLGFGPQLPAASTHGMKFYKALIVLTDKRPAERHWWWKKGHKSPVLTTSRWSRVVPT